MTIREIFHTSEGGTPPDTIIVTCSIPNCPFDYQYHDSTRQPKNGTLIAIEFDSKGALAAAGDHLELHQNLNQNPDITIFHYTEMSSYKTNQPPDVLGFDSAIQIALRAES